MSKAPTPVMKALVGLGVSRGIAIGPIDTVVRFRLEAVSETETRLHFEQRGFEGLQSVMVSFIMSNGFNRMYRDYRTNRETSKARRSCAAAACTAAG